MRATAAHWQVATARLADILGLRTKFVVRRSEIALQVDSTDGALVGSVSARASKYS
jgi:hypothetical protein